MAFVYKYTHENIIFTKLTTINKHVGYLGFKHSEIMQYLLCVIVCEFFVFIVLSIAV